MRTGNARTTSKKRVVLPNKVYHFNEMVGRICKENILTKDSLRSIGQLNAEEWQKFQVYQKNKRLNKQSKPPFSTDKK